MILLKRLFTSVHCLLVLLLTAGPLCAQSRSDSTQSANENLHKPLALHVMYQDGYVFATNPFLKGINSNHVRIDDFRALSLKLSWQTTGSKLWEECYKYPYYGLGLYAADFYDPKEIGYPVAVYGFFNAPFIRMQRFAFTYEIGFGATFNWKAYNPVSNQYNVAIGAGESFFIDAGLNLQYVVFKKITLDAGFSLTHFSNGALRKPNFGINTVAPKLSLMYNFSQPLVFKQQAIPAYRPENEWIVSVYGGVKNVIFDSVNLPVMEKYEGLYFPVFGISTTFNRQVSYKSKLGFGATLTYNGAVNAQAAVENNELEARSSRPGDKILLSIYPSYELVVNKVSLVLQPAFYIYRKKLINQSPAFHQRIGLKYHISDRLFVGITLVDYQFHVSDFIEWNLGYRMKWK